MESILITFLFLFDCIILFVFLRSRQRPGQELEAIETLAEERKMLSNLLIDFKRENSDLRYEMNTKLARVQELAAEIDHEIQVSKSHIQEIGQLTAQQIKELIDKPIDELSRKFISTKKLVAHLEKEQEILSRVILKGQKICEFLDQKVPYEEILTDLEDKKYADTRALLALGKTPREISISLGLTEGEVRLIAGLRI